MGAGPVEDLERAHRTPRSTSAQALARAGTRHDRDRAKVKSLPRPLVIEEEKRAIFVNRSAQRSTELVAPIGRPAAKIKKVRLVERAVGVVAVSRTVELIVAGAGDSRNKARGGAALLRDLGPGCDSQLAQRLNPRI